MNKKAGAFQKRKQVSEVDDCGSKWGDLWEELFKKGTVSVNDSAAKVKTCDEIFDRFSNNVIGYHLGILKKKAQSRSNRSVTAGSVNNALQQFGVTSANPVTPPTIVIDAVDQISGSGCYELMCENMPFLRFSYMKYDTKQEKIVVLLDLPGGTESYDWEFNEIGNCVTITVNWGKSMYDVNTLYKTDLNDKKIGMDHPKLHAMQTEVMNQWYSSKRIPHSRIHVDLGKRVHKDDGTWNIEVIQQFNLNFLDFRKRS